MKIIARTFLLVLMFGCGGDDTCTPGNGAAAGDSCTRDSDCQSCDCMVYTAGEGICIGPPTEEARAVP